MSRNSKWKVLAAMSAVVGALMLSVTPAGASSAHGGGRSFNCNGGDIATGTYTNIIVSGQCSVPDGAAITVLGDIVVQPGAMLDAQSAPSSITVGRDVTALSGALLGLGCQPPELVGNSGHPCMVNPTGHSTITVKGNVTALKAAVVLVNGITVGGNVTALGGGSPEVPWSIKNNTIGGNLAVAGQTTDWVGLLFNKVARNVLLVKVTITDTDPGGNGAYVVQNHIGQNLVCFGVTPKVSGGFGVNVVGGQALGQCADLV